jgi:FAD:protein FMN transferase
MNKQIFNFTFKAMGSPCSLQFYTVSHQHAEDIYTQILQRITELEQRYSRYLETSLISEINRAAGTGRKTSIDQETFALLQYADQCYRESNHLFDVTSGILRKLWHSQQTSLPTSSQLKDITALIGWKKVKWNQRDIYLPLRGMELDFGGIVKEYAADVVATLCLKSGIPSGVVELGGDVRVVGALPNGDGWTIAIRDPRNPEHLITRFKLKSGAVATSGDYERFQIINGVRYSHLLNPKTGFPVTGLQAVTVIAEQCVVAGSLSTIAMLKGHHGLAWLQTLPIAFLCCKNDGQLINQLGV